MSKGKQPSFYDKGLKNAEVKGITAYKQLGSRLRGSQLIMKA